MSKIDLRHFYIGKLSDLVNLDKTLSSIKYDHKILKRVLDKSFKYTDMQYTCLLNDIENDLFAEFEDILKPELKAA